MHLQENLKQSNSYLKFIKSAYSMWSNWNSNTLLMEIQNGTIIWENGLAVPNKGKHIFQYDVAILYMGICLLKRNEDTCQTNIHSQS